MGIRRRSRRPDFETISHTRKRERVIELVFELNYERKEEDTISIKYDRF